MPTNNDSILAKRLSDRCNDQRNYWAERNRQFEEWYRVLRLEDDLAVSGMESFTSNDPRTLYNLALFLLTPKTIPYNIPLDGANETVQAAITQLEGFVTREWRELEKDMRKKGKQGWLRNLSSFNLSTGWYAVRAIADNQGLHADIWNPAEVYQDFDPDIGLGSVAHIYTTSGSAARKNVANNRALGWSYDFGSSQRDVTVIDYWYYNDDGIPTNCVIYDRNFAKKPTPYPHYNEIPVYTSPISGLPDNGSIDNKATEWKKHFGEAIVATNQELFKSFNKQMTFMMQILRDTAQPRIKAKTTSQTLGSELEKKWNTRGAIFTIGTDEDIEAIGMPGIPPELSLDLQTTSRMIERGGLPFALWTGEGISSGYHQALVSAGADQLLRDYREASSFLITDICNAWVRQIKTQNLKPKGFEFPIALPDEALFEIEVRVSIPGDMIQRATTARQLDPNFSMSTTTVMDLIFPEIKDPNREIIMSRRDMAMKSPIMASLDLVSALEESAEALQAEGNDRQAALYAEYAQKARQTLDATMQPAQQSPQGSPGIGNAGMS